MPQIIILAGGKASRLLPITEGIPKALVPVAGKPFIEHQLNLLKREGIKEVILSVGYLGEKIEEYLQDGRRFGVSIKYVYDGDTLKGTGGAVVKALPFLDERFWVMYGDSFLDIQFAPIFQYFLSKNPLALMTIIKNENRWDKSNVKFNDGLGGIIELYSKKNKFNDMKYADYGLSILTKGIFSKRDFGNSFDLSEIFESLSKSGDLTGYVISNRFYEIGSKCGLLETERYINQLEAL